MLANSIKLKGNRFIIELSNSIKILGVFINIEFDQTTNENKIISKVNYRVEIINKVTKFSNTKTNILLNNSLIKVI